MTHECEGHQHLTCKSTDEGSGKADKTVGLDKFIEIDAKQFRGNTQVIAKIEMFNHFENMMISIRVLEILFQKRLSLVFWFILTHFFKFSSILISTSA